MDAIKPIVSAVLAVLLWPLLLLGINLHVKLSPAGPADAAAG